jgi:outer membrane protein
MSATRSVNDLDVDNFGVGLDLSQPIYTGGRLAALERRAAARRDAARADLHQTVLSVERAVGNAWARLAVSSAQIRAADQQIRAAQIAFDGTREEARLGARTTLDVLDAEQELLDARASRIFASSAVQRASYILLESTGQLTVQSLNLGIPTYDVEAYSAAFGRRSGAAPAAAPSVQGQRLDRIRSRYERQDER